MSAILSVRVDPETNKRLEALSKRSKRSKSLLASEAIAAFVEAEEWQHNEIKSGIEDLDSGKHVSHPRVARWLESWGKAGEIKPPR